MKRLIAPLAVVVIVVVALVATGGGGGATGAARPTVPPLSVARLDGSGEFALAGLASAESPTLLARTL